MRNKNNNQSQNQNQETKRGIKGAFGAAKERTIAAANKVTARDGAMVAVGAVGALGVGLGVKAYKKHKAMTALAEVCDENPGFRRRVAEIVED